MLVINKLTAPGGIKRIEIHPDTVRVVSLEGMDAIYYLGSSIKQVTEEAKNEDRP